MDASTRMQPASDLIGSLKALITPAVIAKASSVFGESEAAVIKGLDVALPTVLGALASKVEDRWFMSRLFDLIKEPVADGSFLRDVANLIGSGAASLPAINVGSRFLSLLLGGNTLSLGNALSSVAGVKPSTGSSMLNIAGPLVLGLLGKTVRRNGLDSAGLADMVLGQKDSILAFVPNTLWKNLSTDGQAAETTLRAAEIALPETSPFQFFPLLLLLLGLWGLFSLLTRDESLSSTLPGGFQIRYAAAGIEGKLLAFILDPSQSADNDVWFNFDRLLFEKDATTVKSESRNQLRNIAEIMKAYPSVGIKVGGYTDSSGDPAANLRLSRDQANSVRQELISLGIAAERLTAEGHVQEHQKHPVADNAGKEGRAQNVRVALRVAQK